MACLQSGEKYFLSLALKNSLPRQFTMSKETLLESNTGFPFPKDSPYLKITRLILQKILEGGMVQHTDMVQRQRQTRSSVSCDDISSNVGVRGEKIFTAFLAIIVGILVSLMLALFEKYRAAKNTAIAKQSKRKE